MHDIYIYIYIHIYVDTHISEKHSLPGVLANPCLPWGPSGQEGLHGEIGMSVYAVDAHVL
jgi:hypothetical protein